MSLKNILFEKRAFSLAQDVLKRGLSFFASSLRFNDRTSFDDAWAHAPMIVKVTTNTVKAIVWVTFNFYLSRPVPRPHWLLVLVFCFLLLVTIRCYYGNSLCVFYWIYTYFIGYK